MLWYCPQHALITISDSLIFQFRITSSNMVQRLRLIYEEIKPIKNAYPHMKCRRWTLKNKLFPVNFQKEYMHYEEHDYGLFSLGNTIDFHHRVFSICSLQLRILRYRVWMTLFDVILIMLYQSIGSGMIFDSNIFENATNWSPKISFNYF